MCLPIQEKGPAEGSAEDWENYLVDARTGRSLR